MFRNRISALCAFTLFITSSFSFISCSSNNDTEIITYEDFPIKEIISRQIDYVGFIVEQTADTLNSEVWMVLDGSNQDAEISINGTAVALNKSTVGGKTEFRASLDILPEDELQISLKTGSKTYSGNLKVPASIDLTFPESFNPTADFTMQWTSASDPSLYVADLWIELVNDNDVILNLIPGTARLHTVGRNFYAMYEEEEFAKVTAYLDPLTFKTIDGLIFYAYTLGESKTYTFEEEGEDEEEGIASRSVDKLFFKR